MHLNKCLSWTSLHSHSQVSHALIRKSKGSKSGPCSLWCSRAYCLLSLCSHASVWLSSVSPIYTFSRDTLPQTEEWKQKSGTELKESDSLVDTTGFISPDLRNQWWQQHRHKPTLALRPPDWEAPGELTELSRGFLLYAQRSYVESTSQLTRSCHAS